MCILIYAPGKTLIPRKHLENSCKANPDGFGWAIVTPDQILVQRTMDATEAIDSFLEWRNEHPELPALFHARITTHGTTTVDNCHPFYVGEDKRTLLAHNGILMHVPTDDHRSDTRTFAEDWLPVLGTKMLDDPDSVNDLERFIGWSKMVVLSIDPRLDRWAYILNEHYGDWDGGVWYSNSSYEDPKWERYTQWDSTRSARTYYVGHSTSLVPVDDDDSDVTDSSLETAHCEFCDIDFLYARFESNACPDCGLCPDCNHWACMCPSTSLSTPRGHSVFNEWMQRQDYWYVDSNGWLQVYDDQLELWREAFDDEYESFEETFGFVVGVRYPQYIEEPATSSLDELIDL